MQRMYKQVTSFKCSMVLLFAVTAFCVATLNAIVIQ